MDYILQENMFQIWRKTGLGYTLGDFFIKSSGHPGADFGTFFPQKVPIKFRPPPQKKMGANCNFPR
jgi:hypothetical protein